MWTLRNRLQRRLLFLWPIRRRQGAESFRFVYLGSQFARGSWKGKLMPSENMGTTQLSRPKGLSRMGGAASRGSTAVPASRGKNFDAMEGALLKSKKPNPKKLSANPQPGRQYFTSAAGGSGGVKPKSDTDKTIGNTQTPP